MDTEAEVAAFKSLKRPQMLIRLRQINDTIAARKQKLPLSGKREDFVNLYRDWVENLVATGQIPGVPLLTAEPAADDNLGESEESDGSPAGPSLLSRIMIPARSFVAFATFECLHVLNSPAAETVVPDVQAGELSKTITPLLNYVHVLATAENDLGTLSHDPAVNYEALRIEEKKRLPSMKAPKVFRDFFVAMGIDFVAKEHGEEAPQGQKEGGETVAYEEASRKPVSNEDIAAEINVVWNAVNQSLMRWRESFPRPPATAMSWPIDFDDDEKTAARAYIRRYIDANPTSVQTTDASQLKRLIETLVQGAPLDNIKNTKVMKLIWKEKVSEFKRLKDQSSERKVGRRRTRPKRDESVEFIRETDTEDEEDGIQVSTPPKTRGKRKRGLLHEEDGGSEVEEEG